MSNRDNRLFILSDINDKINANLSFISDNLFYFKLIFKQILYFGHSTFVSH